MNIELDFVISSEDMDEIEEISHSGSDGSVDGIDISRSRYKRFL